MKDLSKNLSKIAASSLLRSELHKCSDWMTKEMVNGGTLPESVIGDKEGHKYVIVRNGLTLCGSINSKAGVVDEQAGIPELEWLKGKGYVK